jgi:hypothetical protein
MVPRELRPERTTFGSLSDLTIFEKELNIAAIP